MDPFSQVLCIVVVVLVLIIIYITAQGAFVHIYTGHIILKTFSHNVKQTHQKDIACVTDNTFTVDADTLTNTVDFSKNKSTQTDDSKHFITCYNHVQAKHQENLIAVDTIENTLLKTLAYQLRSEFHGYMQYTLNQAASTVIPVPEPTDFQSLHTTSKGIVQKLPNIHIEHYAHYKKHELQEANKEVERETREARPKDPTHPWTIQPFGGKTCSQASFARKRA